MTGVAGSCLYVKSEYGTVGSVLLALLAGHILNVSAATPLMTSMHKPLGLHGAAPCSDP